VEDLFEYARAHRRPSGIQRLAFEIYRALHQRDAGAGRVQFVRHAPVSNGFRVVAWAELAALFATLTDGAVATAAPDPSRGEGGAARAFARTLVQRLPTSLRPAVVDVLLTGAAAGSAIRMLLLALLRASGLSRGGGVGAAGGVPRPPPSGVAWSTAPPGGQPVRFATAADAGDVVLVFGAPWSHPGYARLIRGLRDRHGLRVAMLVYDLIPLRRPEWFDGRLVPLFRHWFETILPLCDRVFAISAATARDLEDHARARGLALRRPVVQLPLGTALGQSGAGGPGIRALPAPGTYVLIVAIIEIRKNHLLLFRIWRRLLDELPRDQVPTLVFAGRIGWLVGDLMAQIANTGHLGGKLVIVESPTDAELAVLYRGCLFTVFPSFYEGWGLPVTESLAAGKPCLISDRTALPEAGGALARSFDPDDANDAYAKIRAVILDRDDLSRWQARVVAEFKPVPWSATIDALLAGLDMTMPALPGAAG
jgi:glycosyltransferase involved in cell wall biosynthesis